MLWHAAMLRLLTMLVLGIAVTWALFFVQVDNKSVAMHLADIWHSPVVQQKVRMVQRKMPGRAQRPYPRTARRTAGTARRAQPWWERLR